MSVTTAPGAATHEIATTPRGVVRDGPGRWIVQGRAVEMPVVVRDASSGAVTWLVPSAEIGRAHV